MLVSVDKTNNLPIQEVYYGAEESFFQHSTAKTETFRELDYLSAKGHADEAQSKKVDNE